MIVEMQPVSFPEWWSFVCAPSYNLRSRPKIPAQPLAPGHWLPWRWSCEVAQSCTPRSRGKCNEQVQIETCYGLLAGSKGRTDTGPARLSPA